jgi:peptidyl-prolyl cis-trans isomerase SurA
MEMKLRVSLLRGRMPRGPKYFAAWIYFGSILGTFLFLAGALHAELVDRVVAIVNNDIILQSDLNQTLAVIGSTLDEQGYSRSQRLQILKEQRGKILEQLIYDKLTDQQVKQHKIKIGDDEVDAAIERMRNLNRLSEDELRRQLELEGISYDDYRKQIKERMLRARLVNREVKSKIVITDEDVQSYYKAHADKYGVHTKYELSHILIKVPPPADADAKKDALARINHVYDGLQRGESFEELARKYSEAPSAERSGSLGIFDIAILSDQIKQALKGLEAKQYTKVVDTDQGYQIFYVQSVNQAGGQGIEEVRSEIQEKLFSDVVDRKFNEWIKELRQRSHIQVLE